MRLIGKNILEKFRRKHLGNIKLNKSIHELIHTIESNDWQNGIELKESRIDADCVHNDGFYFFNIANHRTMILIEFEEKEATVAWIGKHNDYESVFKNNKNTIKHWLKIHNWIE